MDRCEDRYGGGEGSSLAARKSELLAEMFEGE
jgi:hypothetical protein